MVTEKTLRNRVVRIIAATRFPFVDQENWGEGYVTIVNDEVKRRGIDTDEAVVYPSIVITKPDGRIQELADIAVAKEVSPSSVNRWRLISGKAGLGKKEKKFFLYVPPGSEKKALQLLEKNKISYAGLRVYKIIDGILSVTPIKTPDDDYDHRRT
ncbi:MAG: hypothetical protein ABSA11_00195 [Candidatus Bathyarchaeia archaeon]|jgi:hypothetical protein